MCWNIILVFAYRRVYFFLAPPRKRENEKANLVYYLGKINVKVTRAPQPSGLLSASDTAQ